MTMLSESHKAMEDDERRFTIVQEHSLVEWCGNRTDLLRQIAEVIRAIRAKDTTSEPNDE